VDKYILRHADFGWLSASATYTSDHNDAKVVDYETAIEYCRKYCTRDNFGEVDMKLFLVKLSDVRRIAND
jgi:hypothetical protein